MRAFYVITLVITIKVAQMSKAKLVKIGNSTGVILPKSMLENLNLEAGDEIELSQSKDNIIISRDDSNFSAYVETAREIMRDYDLTMRELAK